MTEDKRNTVSVKIFQSTQDEMLDEQLRVKRTGRPKPSIAELVDMAWESRKTAKENPSTHPSTSEGNTLQKSQKTSGDYGVIANSQGRNRIEPSEHSEWLNILEGILKSGHTVAIEAITRNIYAFDMLIHSTVESKVDDYRVRTFEEMRGDLSRVIEDARRLTKSKRRTEREPSRRAG